MAYGARKRLYKAIENERNSKVIAYITGDRPNAETQIAPDCLPMFVDILDDIGPTQKISLVLHTNGGQTAAAWQLVNLIKSFCEEFEVLIPLKAMSAGTLISLGANEILMSKQAVLGPIDPSLTHPLGPLVPMGNQMARIPVSVEAVRGYLDATEELKVTDAHTLGSILMDLSNKVHPLVLGEIFRSREQIRFLADKLLRHHVQDSGKIKDIIDFLCADSGSHDYTINRREAEALGLPVVKPSAEFYDILKKLHKSYTEDMRLLEPFNPNVELGVQGQLNYVMVRGLIESPTRNRSYGFLSEGTLVRSQVPNPNDPAGVAVFVSDQRTFEGWKKL